MYLNNIIASLDHVYIVHGMLRLSDTTAGRRQIYHRHSAYNIYSQHALYLWIIPTCPVLQSTECFPSVDKVYLNYSILGQNHMYIVHETLPLSNNTGGWPQKYPYTICLQYIILPACVVFVDNELSIDHDLHIIEGFIIIIMYCQ